VEISAEDLRKIREEMRGRVITAAQSAQAAGKLPASIARLVNELTEPVINWRELLAQNIQSCLTDDFTFQRPNRRHMYSGVFLPSLKKDETVDVTVAIDMSGSISDKMAQEFLSEVWGIANSYADFRISVLCFDTQVYNFQVFTPDTVDDLLSYECKGGGGTDFMAFWNYWRENDIEPKKAVIFTDGYPGGEWGPSNYADTLWIITEGRHTKIVPPFGEYAYFEAQQGVVEVGTV
jgi:predicted metal-dependent peptidase